ncbi:MAG: ATP-binding protein [Deltaproteobacteria bacterium]|nr:MAG: ATP-binding protein [Deltaproteobacteria bacterium]
MWIGRISKKNEFLQALEKLDRQVLIVRGARQVGKTSFILQALTELKDYHKIYFNFLYTQPIRSQGIDYYGSHFFGKFPSGEEFIRNLEREIGSFDKLQKPWIIFIDEVDRFPKALEAVQTLATFSDKIKCVLTGSNLENITVENAATGRKKYFDLYPISFEEFLASSDDKCLKYYQEVEPSKQTDFYHTQLETYFETYLRLGGLPRLLDIYLTSPENKAEISNLIKDLATTIEENVKTVLGEKFQLYEYEDVLRKLVLLSMNTLKLTHLQVQHTSRKEAVKLVSKTVGARVAHKIRLWESESDLSKYILFDTGLANYLMNGSNLLETSISSQNKAILYETGIGNELIRKLVTRDDLHYWKSGNRAEVEFFLRSPKPIGIDVKSTTGSLKSLYSFALAVEDVGCLVKIQKTHSLLKKLTQHDSLILPNSKKSHSLPFPIT